MSRRVQLRIFLMIPLLALLVAVSPHLASAQIPSPPDKPSSPIASPSKRPNRFPPNEDIERRLGVTSIPVGRGVRLLVDNRTTGRITVRGWERDVVEARATSVRGDEVLLIAKSEDEGPRLFLKADYANLESAAPTEELELPPEDAVGPIQVHLEVNVPRHIELELIRVFRSDVEITGVETPLIVMGQRSNVTLKNVGSVEVHTRTGLITIENARGISDVSSSTGAIKVTNSRGAVRATSIAGSIEVRCVKGRTDVGNTRAPIELVGIDGDVEAIAASSTVRFTGRLNADNRYYLKSMSGRVEMIVPTDTRGFNATLTSYKGNIESDFPLDTKRAAQESHTSGQRLSGRFGNGSSQITLDSFEGLVKLSKISPASIISCP